MNGRKRIEKYPMFDAVVIGVSMGGLQALKAILPHLPKSFVIPVIIVLHQSTTIGSSLADLLDGMFEIDVKEAELNEKIQAGYVYLSSPGYHLLIEQDKTFALSIDPPVNFSIPSIDVLFESAAEAYGDGLVGIILTGANADGSQGLKVLGQRGGLTVVQDPCTAEAKTMPEAAIATGAVRHIIPLDEIGEFILRLADDVG